MACRRGRAHHRVLLQELVCSKHQWTILNVGIFHLQNVCKTLQLRQICNTNIYPSICANSFLQSYNCTTTLFIKKNCKYFISKLVYVTYFFLGQIHLNLCTGNHKLCRNSKFES
jgi:hypothetical protein